MGSSTSGSWEFYLDGSDVGLSTNGEDIDALCILDNGDILMSTSGTVNTTGTKWRDEDVLLFSPSSIGSSSSGSWSLLFDGSDVGMTSSSEDLDALTIDGNDLLLSVTSTFDSLGVQAADEDVIRFAGSYGSSTSGSFTIEGLLTALGISGGEDVDGMSIR